MTMIHLKHMLCSVYLLTLLLFSEASIFEKRGNSSEYLIRIPALRPPSLFKRFYKNNKGITDNQALPPIILPPPIPPGSFVLPPAVFMKHKLPPARHPSNFLSSDILPSSSTPVIHKFQPVLASSHLSINNHPAKFNSMTWAQRYFNGIPPPSPPTTQNTPKFIGSSNNPRPFHTLPPTEMMFPTYVATSKKHHKRYRIPQTSSNEVRYLLMSTPARKPALHTSIKRRPIPVPIVPYSPEPSSSGVQYQSTSPYAFASDSDTFADHELAYKQMIRQMQRSTKPKRPINQMVAPTKSSGSTFIVTEVSDSDKARPAEHVSFATTEAADSDQIEYSPDEWDLGVQGTTSSTSQKHGPHFSQDYGSLLEFQENKRLQRGQYMVPAQESYRRPSSANGGSVIIATNKHSRYNNHHHHHHSNHENLYQRPLKSSYDAAASLQPNIRVVKTGTDSKVFVPPGMIAILVPSNLAPSAYASADDDNSQGEFFDASSNPKEIVVKAPEANQLRPKPTAKITSINRYESNNPHYSKPQIVSPIVQPKHQHQSTFHHRTQVLSDVKNNYDIVSTTESSLRVQLSPADQFSENGNRWQSSYLSLSTLKPRVHENELMTPVGDFKQYDDNDNNNNNKNANINNNKNVYKYDNAAGLFVYDSREREANDTIDLPHGPPVTTPITKQTDDVYETYLRHHRNNNNNNNPLIHIGTIMAQQQNGGKTTSTYTKPLEKYRQPHQKSVFKYRESSGYLAPAALQGFLDPTSLKVVDHHGRISSKTTTTTLRPFSRADELHGKFGERYTNSTLRPTVRSRKVVRKRIFHKVLHDVSN